MAATITMSPGQDLLDRMMERVYNLAERATKSRIGDLLATSGLIKPSVSPFGDFGVVVAAGSRPLPIAHAIKEVTVFTVEEARDRLSSFITGRFSPSTVTELLSYLNDKFLRLETRITAHGLVNYLVDLKTNGSVAAAQVDPRLGHARMLMSSVRAAIHQHLGGVKPTDVWTSWAGMKMDLDTRKDKLAYTVVRGEGWIGKACGIASVDPRENLALIQAAQAKGVDLILPERTVGGAANGVLIAGLPILIRSRSLKAASVHPDLAHDSLAKQWGIGMDQAYARMSDRAQVEIQQSRMRSANVINMADYHDTKSLRRDEFLKKFVRPQARPDDDFEISDDAELALGFGGTASSSPRDLVIRTPADGGADYVFDKDMNERVFMSPRALPSDRYRLESEMGEQIGFVDVGTGGRARRLSMDGSEMPEDARLPPSSEADDVRQSAPALRR